MAQDRELELEVEVEVEPATATRQRPANRGTTGPAMQELGTAERQRLFERFGKSYAPGEVVYEEGTPSEHCYLLQEGRVRLVKRIRGAERSLTVLKPGDLFGEDALLMGR